MSYPQTSPFRLWYDDNDPILSLQFKGIDEFANTRLKWMQIEKKFGTDRFKEVMANWYNNDEDFDATVEPTLDHTAWQLEQIANNFLREDSKREMCRKCGSPGSETGTIESQPQEDDEGHPTLDKEGNVLYVDFPELECDKGHRWYKGEGKARGIDGKDPILFENHLQDRKRREIYTSIGTPDPSIQQGMYNRTHPQGRKVNSKEQRKRNGASFFR
jgi:hypothetical protein